MSHNRSTSRIFAIFRKEMLEIYAERNSRRASGIQAAIFVGCLGILFPLQRMTLSKDPNLVLPYVLGSGLLAASLAAESLGHERANGTLDSLLASPLQESEILVGKILASVLYGAGLSVVSLVCASMIEYVSRKGADLPLSLIFALVVLCTALSILASSVAFIVAMFVRSPRVAHQLCSLGTVLILIGIAVVWETLGLAVSMISLGVTALFTLILGGVALVAASNIFRRTRVFDEV